MRLSHGRFSIFNRLTSLLSLTARSISMISLNTGNGRVELMHRPMLRSFSHSLQTRCPTCRNRSTTTEGATSIRGRVLQKRRLWVSHPRIFCFFSCFRLNGVELEFSNLEDGYTTLFTAPSHTSCSSGQAYISSAQPLSLPSCGVEDQLVSGSKL